MIPTELCPTTWVSSLIPFAQALGPFGAWVIAFAGWFVVSRGNDKREKRKEIRAALTAARELVGQIEALATEYYTAEAGPDAVATGFKVKRSLKRLAADLSSIKRAHPKLALEAELVWFRQIVTGGDFDSASRPLRLTGDILFVEISDKASALISAIEDRFRVAYG